MKEKVLISGGTGLIGRHLAGILEEQGYEVAFLSRSKGEGTIRRYLWDLSKGYVEEAAIRDADYIINLAGANLLDKRWSKEFKNEIIRSRTESILLLKNKLKEVPNKVKSFVSASAIGYYGFDTGSALVNEETKPGNDFLAEVVRQWEKAADEITNLNIRTVKIRIGIVLSDKGGALEKLTGTIKMNAGAAVASGHQYISWIHIEDVCRIIIQAMKDPHMEGVYNAVAPEPVTNETLVKSIAGILGKFTLLPNIPAFALKLMLGSERAALLIGGNRVSSDKIRRTGYKFLFPELKSALQNLLQ